MENQPRMISDEEAMDRLRKDIIILLYHQPFFAYLLAKTKKVISDRVPVAGVAVIEGDITLYIHPKGYLRYTKEERLFILIHEMMHVIFHHHSRKMKRNHKLWNIATDVAINQLIETNVAHMPKDCLRIDSWKEKGILLPAKRSAEEYYQLLSEEKQHLDTPEHMGHGPHGQNEDAGEPPQSPQNSNGEGGGSTEKNDPLEQLHPTWEDSTEVSEHLAESMVRSMVQEAYKEANGHVPSEIRTTIQELIQPKIQWKQILYNFVAKRRATNKQATWKKRNRRLGNQVMGYKKNRKLVIAVAIDTSGSISEDDFKTFYTEMVTIQKNGATVILMECDAKVHTVAKFTKHYSPEFVGGGGTDFRPVFTAIEQKEDRLLGEKPDALIFFTDGYGIAPDKPTIPTLWCLTKNGKMPWNEKRENISWGTVLHLD